MVDLPLDLEVLLLDRLEDPELYLPHDPLEDLPILMNHTKMLAVHLHDHLPGADPQGLLLDQVADLLLDLAVDLLQDLRGDLLLDLVVDLLQDLVVDLLLDPRVTLLLQMHLREVLKVKDDFNSILHLSFLNLLHLVIVQRSIQVALPRPNLLTMNHLVHLVDLLLPLLGLVGLLLLLLVVDRE